jgi:hypothetical protein
MTRLVLCPPQKLWRNSFRKGILGALIWKKVKELGENEVLRSIPARVSKYFVCPRLDFF